MDQFKILQKFIVAWMDELWWSMRDRVGALSMIESIQNSWNAAGRKVGEIAKAEGLGVVKTVELSHSILGRIVTVKNDSVLVSSCPFWDRILDGNLEYGLRCEEFICAPFLLGIKDAFNAKEVQVETNLRLAHVAKAKLEYKLNKLRAMDSPNSQIEAQKAKLEKQLIALGKSPACIFHIK
ncbi:MAG: hypothetical protein ACFFD8_01895 [Candidatus Thorarchaeota archaeon]